MIRVGLVGLGFMGTRHFGHYRDLAGRAKVVAVCDADAARRGGDWSSVGGNLPGAGGRAEALRDIRTFARWQDIVSAPDIDVIDITLPTFLHPDVSIAAMEAGKHVLCEKPMALTIEACDRMIDVSRRTNRRLMIAQCIRFWPEYAWLKQAHDERRFGTLRALSLRRQASYPEYTYEGWFRDAAKSGGAILDLHIHDVDFAIHMLGKPESVHSRGCARDDSIERVHSLWSYDNDCAVYVEGFWDLPPGFDFNMGFTAVYEEAAVHWDMATGKPMTVYRRGHAPETVSLPPQDAYFAEIEYFISCVEQDRLPARTTPEESRDAILVAMAEQRSIQLGVPIPVE